jgi:Tfp pilus assembly protein PilF
VLAALAAVAAVPPNLAKAIEAQQRLAAERPGDAAVFNDLGNLLLLVPRPAEAEAAYRKAVEIDPHKVSALYNLGLLLQRRRELREATDLYQRVLDEEPGHAWAHYQLGTIHEVRGQESRAVESYARAFALDPQLAFPEVNPHVVENKLLTQAMLRAYRSDLAPPQAPNIYDDPARISALLEPRLMPAPRDQTAAQRPGEPAGRQPAGQGATVLREGDLDRGNPAGQAVPQGGAPRGVGVPITRTTPRSLREWTRPEPTPEELPEGMPVPDEEQPVITPPPGGVYYRPGVQSTGRLSLQVVPEGRRTGRSGPTR